MATRADHDKGNCFTAVAESIQYAARHLGTGDAGTHLGALESLAIETKEGSQCIARALWDVAEALNNIAKAIASRDNGEDDAS